MGLSAEFARAAALLVDPRLIVIVLRGALDGLSTRRTRRRPSYVSLRGALRFPLAAIIQRFLLMASSLSILQCQVLGVSSKRATPRSSTRQLTSYR